MITKKELRIKYKKIRANIKDRDIKSKIACKRLMSLYEYKKAKNVAVFKPISDEINVDYIIDDVMKNKTLLLPRVEGKNMVFAKVENLDELVLSGYNILEPPMTAQVVDDIDIAIVPALAYSDDKYRLGYGAAYYDRYFKNSVSYLIGICFDEQIANDIIIESHDIPVNTVITDKRRI